jgi:hypothetical protein
VMRPQHIHARSRLWPSLSNSVARMWAGFSAFEKTTFWSPATRRGSLANQTWINHVAQPEGLRLVVRNAAAPGVAVVKAVVTAAAHVDDTAGSPAVSSEASAEMTVAEAATPKAAAPEPTTAATGVSAAETTTRVSTTAARVPAEAATAGMTATEPSATEVATASPTATEVTAEGRSVGRRERAERNRNGGSSENRFE